MKLKAIVVILAMTFTLSACSADISDINTFHDSGSIDSADLNESKLFYNSGSIDSNVEYGSISAEFLVYEKPEALVEAADLVFVGKVVARSFQVLDYTTGLPATEKTEEIDKIFCTIYTVDVVTSYKGGYSKTMNIRTQGGIKGECLSEQFQVLKTTSSNVIPIMEWMPQINIGETYLFSLMEFEGTDPVLLNPGQGVIPIEKSITEDKYEFLSTKDIISYFGEEQWSTFKSDNNIRAE